MLHLMRSSLSVHLNQRSFLEGRLTEEQLSNFRREVGGNGLPSYPHPYLIHDGNYLTVLQLNVLQGMNVHKYQEHSALGNKSYLYLMPDYWQFPTVSMGLGPIMSIYQAHIQKYLMNRVIKLFATSK
jgi:pyruvate dehydrogenase E1 component